MHPNSTSIGRVNRDIAALSYDDNVFPATNLTVPGKSGLRGILFDRGLSCEANPTQVIPMPPIPSGVPKIALIQRGQCSFVNKLLYAQASGAVAAIVYDNTLDQDGSDDDRMLIPLGSGVDIPAYFVDLHAGVELYNRLSACENMTSSVTGNASRWPAVRVLMLPADSSGPNPWELTLMIVIALLAVSFFASVGMHYHLWRKRRRQRRMIEQGLAPPPFSLPILKEKPLVDKTRLDTFPTHIISKTKLIQPPSVAVLADEAVDIDIAPPIRSPTHDDICGLRLSAESPLESCVICLADWSEGDEVRRLPCKHEYHRECIDPWLTSKSAECPLCKFNCALDDTEPMPCPSSSAPTPTLVPSTLAHTPTPITPEPAAELISPTSRITPSLTPIHPTHHASPERPIRRWFIPRLFRRSSPSLSPSTSSTSTQNRHSEIGHMA